MKFSTGFAIAIALAWTTRANASQFAWADVLHPTSEFWAMTLGQDAHELDPKEIRKVLMRVSGDALAGANDLVERMPDSAAPWALRAIVQRRVANWTACVADGEQALARGSGPVHLGCLARTCATASCQDDPHIATRLFAASRSTGGAEAWMRLGELWLEQGNLADAIAALRHSLALAPRVPDARLLLTVAYDQIGDDDNFANELSALAGASQDWMLAANESTRARFLVWPRGLVGLSDATRAHADAVRCLVASAPDPGTEAAWLEVARLTTSASMRLRARRHAKSAKQAAAGPNLPAYP